MRRILPLSVVALVMASGCTTKPALTGAQVAEYDNRVEEPAIAAAQGVRAPRTELAINTQEDFRRQIVGMPVSTGDDTLMLHEDGTVSGQMAGEEVAGVWSWDNGLICHIGKPGSNNFDGDCGPLANAEFSAVSFSEPHIEDQAPTVVYETELPVVAEPELIEIVGSENVQRTRQSIINESTEGVSVSF